VTVATVIGAPRRKPTTGGRPATGRCRQRRFHIVIATAKPGGATADYREQPDPNLLYLAAGDLVYAYTGGQQDLAEEAIFMPPACSFHVERRDFNPRTPVVIYVIPKRTPPLRHLGDTEVGNVRNNRPDLIERVQALVSARSHFPVVSWVMSDR